MVGTFFGVGMWKPGPGTAGSLAAMLVWAFLAPHLPAGTVLPVNVALIILATAIGIPAATAYARGTGKKDPQQVVIDEVAGQWLTLLAAPLRWKWMIIGLVLFRLFDMTKPFPIRRLERLPEGTGVVVDDLAAGVYGLIVMQLLLHFGILGR